MAENHPRERHGERSDLARFYTAALADQVSRGMSVAEYADEIGVTAATLYSWRRRLRATPGEVAPSSDPLGLIEVKVSRSSATPSDSGFVVRFASGREVRIPEGFDAASLRRLLEVFESCGPSAGGACSWSSARPTCASCSTGSPASGGPASRAPREVAFRMCLYV